ncbi:putative retrotransposon Copia-like protein [Helianthus annuus]|uniref:Putative gag-polypeptide of LTR copia-type n=1 Tax=Helianthus annuus TaxID=4232 RepID=A0A251RN08_HELAN|nr:putative retrotransposon Copia-like protein [Helianthus annuus]
MASPDSSSSTKSDATLPMATLLHMLTIKLSSTNYLVWIYQVFPLLSHQKLTGYVDGTIQAPAKNTITDGAEVPNPDYSSWLEADQRVLLLLQSSLTEEAMAEAMMAFESAYSNASVERTQTLRDSLRQLRKVRRPHQRCLSLANNPPRQTGASLLVDAVAQAAWVPNNQALADEVNVFHITSYVVMMATTHPLSRACLPLHKTLLTMQHILLRPSMLIVMFLIQLRIGVRTR